MHLQMALGALNWTPETFWASTMHEFNAACEGRRRAGEAVRGDVEAATYEDHEMMKEKFGG